MGKDREHVPKATRESVMGEFSYRCALCGTDDPQLHHIDEDPSNNEEMNLIPLCPNCHLTDQHDPTKQIDEEILQLFRRHRDPTILSSQFSVLYKRARPFLRPEDYDYEEKKDAVNTFLSFVSSLEHGDHYNGELSALITKGGVSLGTLYLDPPRTPSEKERREKEREEREKKRRSQYNEKLRSNTDEVEGLIIELLKFQDWEPPESVYSRGD